MKKRDYFSKRGNFNFNFFDYTLFALIFTVLLISLSTLYSVSSIPAAQKYGSSLFYVKKQAVWAFLGFFSMIFIIFADLEKFREKIPYVTFGTLILLLSTLFMPPIEHVRRWIPLGFMRLQTSELAKISFCLFFADYFDRNYSKVTGSFKNLLKPGIIIIIMLALIAAEPDLGTPTLIFGTALFMLITAGVKPLYVFIPLLAFIPVFLVELIRHPYRIARLKSFMAPWENHLGKGYQLFHSLIAVGSGGWLGVGSGASYIKLKYLPESHTDFIFPIISEETGFLGSCLIVLFFVFFMKRGVKIASMAESYFLSLLAAGAAFMIVFQAFFNISMSVGLIPTKGLPLPFFSYGGSSLLATMVLSGFILNVSLRRKKNL